MKELLFVGGSAAVGEYLSRQFGAQIEAKAVELKVPQQIAHAAIVGAAAVTGFVILRAIF